MAAPAPRCVCMIAITWADRWEAAREGNSRVGFAPAQPCGPDLHRDIARRSSSRALWLGTLITVSRTCERRFSRPHILDCNRLEPLALGPNSSFYDAVLKVRIHLPPAESQVRTCLSREFAFLRREA